MIPNDNSKKNCSNGEGRDGRKKGSNLFEIPKNWILTTSFNETCYYSENRKYQNVEIDRVIC